MTLRQRAAELVSSDVSLDLCRISLAEGRNIAGKLAEFEPDTLGIAWQLSPTGQLETVAFATSSRVYVLCGEVLRAEATIKSLREFLSGPPDYILAGFNMARLALYIYRGVGSHLQGVDLSTFLSKSTREPLSPASVVYERIDPRANRSKINAVWLDRGETNVSLRAWLSAYIAERFLTTIKNATRVDTSHLEDKELQCLGDLVVNLDLLEAAVPKEMESDFESIKLVDGHYTLTNARYKTRVRASEQTEIIMETSCGRSVVGKAVGANGKSTRIAFRGPLHGDIDLKSVRVVGREEATNAERAREEFLLLLLQGQLWLQSSNFIRLLWFPEEDILRPLSKLLTGPDGRFPKLNDSQATAAVAMSNNNVPLVIVHGPPGTGKTSTIAAAVEECTRSEGSAGTWIIAQSNVGVKNIAEKLLSSNIDFKLIVSKEFHFEWHEHLYTALEHHLIRSDDLGSELVSTERLLGASETILCTLSTLSNPVLDSSGVYRAVPVNRLIVDEASQIDTFEFMHLFHKYKSLQKVCLFGDPKQLPPYGQETAPDMRSIFEIKHLRPYAYFLNEQYRMPTPLGDFISEEVYDGKLHSKHAISAFSSVAFIDVRKGQEGQGRSKENIEEVHAVANLVKEYYAKKEFCVITPYDAQRKAIQEALKRENLRWDTVYNVDSFQGHEAEYVIVSVVRTSGAGFLKSMRRMNVMLTRCKKGMVVVTNQQFLRSAGADTLLGKLARYWVSQNGASATWTDSRRIINREADMPGVPGKGILMHAVDTQGRQASVSQVQSATPVRTNWTSLAAAARVRQEPDLDTLAEDNFPVLPGSRGLGGFGRSRSSAPPAQRQPSRSWALKDATNGSTTTGRLASSMARLSVNTSRPKEPPQAYVYPEIRSPTAFPALSNSMSAKPQLQGKWGSQSDVVKSWRSRG